jgi:ATP-dependent protease HslVU (ClpYQ) ATPase subunit
LRHLVSDRHRTVIAREFTVKIFFPIKKTSNAECIGVDAALVRERLKNILDDEDLRKYIL